MHRGACPLTAGEIAAVSVAIESHHFTNDVNEHIYIFRDIKNNTFSDRNVREQGNLIFW